MLKTQQHRRRGAFWLAAACTAYFFFLCFFCFELLCLIADRGVKRRASFLAFDYCMSLLEPCGQRRCLRSNVICGSCVPNTLQLRPYGRRPPGCRQILGNAYQVGLPELAARACYPPTTCYPSDKALWLRLYCFNKQLAYALKARYSILKAVTAGLNIQPIPFPSHSGQRVPNS